MTKYFQIRPGAKTIKKETNSTQNKSQTPRAKQYEVTSFLSTDCELSSKNVYSLGTWKRWVSGGSEPDAPDGTGGPKSK